MINVTTLNFETEVMQASQHTPVLVDFWAPWCGPCKVIGPVLEQIETAYAGRFKLVKVDTEQEQELAAAFGIRSLPTCMLVVNGQPVDGFTGALPEGQIKAFLDKHVPAPQPDASPSELPSGAALAQMDPQEALAQLTQTVQADPKNDDAQFDLIKLLLTLGRTEQAAQAFEAVAHRAAGVRRLDSLARVMAARAACAQVLEPQAHVASLTAAIAANKRDFESRFALAQWLMGSEQFTLAMDELLEILMRDKDWNEGLARKTFIAILDFIEPPPAQVAQGQVPEQDPTVATYRRRLSSVVLS